MKTFTFVDGRIRSGVRLTNLREDDQNGGIILGEFGHGCKAVTIRMDKFSQPEVAEDGRVYDAYLKFIRPTEGAPFYVLSVDRNGNGRAVLLRVVTEGGCGEKVHGTVKLVQGHLSRELCSGHAQNHPIFDSGTWTDSIVYLVQDEILKVDLGGVRQSYRVALRCDGVVLVEPWEVSPAASVDQTVKDGENKTLVSAPIATTPATESVVKTPIPENSLAGGLSDLDKELNRVAKLPPEVLANGVNGRNHGKKNRRWWRQVTRITCTA